MTQSRRQERLRAGEGDETIKETGDREDTVDTEETQSTHRTQPYNIPQ